MTMPPPYRGNPGAAGSSYGSSLGGMMPKDVLPKGYRTGSIGRFNPQQNQLFSSLFQHTLPESYLQRLASGDETGFAPQEEMAQRDFQEALGGLSSRFSGMGAGARRSSGFQNVSSQAASDFANRLRSQRHDLQREALNDLMSLSSLLLGQTPEEKFMIEKRRKSPSFLKQLGTGLAKGLGGGLSGFSSLLGL